MTPEEMLEREHERNLQGLENVKRHIRWAKPRIVPVENKWQFDAAYMFKVVWPEGGCSQPFPSIAAAMYAVDTTTRRWKPA